MTRDFKRLDFMKALYIDIMFSVPAAKTFVITDAWEANLPGIADALYGDINFWWVIGLYNGVLDPITDVVRGKIFRAPNKEDIVAFLESKKDELQQSRVVTI
jgi:hypothetical protein